MKSNVSNPERTSGESQDDPLLSFANQRLNATVNIKDITVHGEDLGLCNVQHLLHERSNEDLMRFLTVFIIYFFSLLL